MQLGFEQKNRQMIDLLIMLLTFDNNYKKSQILQIQGNFHNFEKTTKKQSLKTK